MSKSLRSLRPFLESRSGPVSAAARTAHLRFYSAVQPQVEVHEPSVTQQKTGDADQRSGKLEAIPGHFYPRVRTHNSVVNCDAFAKRYDSLKPGESQTGEFVEIHGRIHNFRKLGRKLLFIDLSQHGHSVQAVVNSSKIGTSEFDSEDLEELARSLRRGHIFSIKGSPHRTERGELSVLALEPPQLLSPCLRRIPKDLVNEETRIRNRHVDFLVNPWSAHTIRLRSDLIQYVRQFLLDEGHIEVQTPILAATAGGAVAKPFRTSAIEFADREISMRIAPELWLKRMVLGGFDRIFEIGTSFRNEGLGMSHNPEFTTCEFYQAYADLEELIDTTERMFTGLFELSKTKIAQEYRSLKERVFEFRTPFRRLDFIPALEAAINYVPSTLELPAQTEIKRRLPDLSSPDAETEVLQLFQDLNIAPPAILTLPRLLDKLCSIYIEHKCKSPTFVINHPECLSPLSKSFIHPENGQRVSARAELFIDSMEIANMYEEENSPFEQRRKFVQQMAWRDEENAGGIDENYLEALEWGLPPTGGWGCGLDRMCMFFSGTRRIADVLAFGSLRNVVALGRGSSGNPLVAPTSEDQTTVGSEA